MKYSTTEVCPSEAFYIIIWVVDQLNGNLHFQIVFHMNVVKKKVICTYLGHNCRISKNNEKNVYIKI